MNRGFLSRLMAFLLPVALMRLGVAPDDGGGGGTPPAGSTPPAGNNPDDNRETFSREYVKELREENKGWRLKAQQAEKERDEHKTAAEKAAADADTKVKDAHTAAEQRVIRAELKAEALKAGMVDLDGLKLADLTKVKINDAGEVEGAPELMEELKKSKPYLFGSTQNSSTPNTPPGSKPPAAKKATEMTDEEYAKARSQFK
jgi:hypothetical protein